MKRGAMGKQGMREAQIEGRPCSCGGVDFIRIGGMVAEDERKGSRRLVAYLLELAAVKVQQTGRQDSIRDCQTRELRYS